MKSLSLSKLLGGGSTSTPSPDYDSSQFTHVLSFTPSPQDSKTTIVERINPQSDSKTPLFTIKTSSSKPQLQLSRIIYPNSQPIPIASASFHTFSSKADISLQNQQFTLKKDQNSLSGGYAFTCPPMGQLKWDDPSGGLGSSAIELSDSSTGQKLARYGRDKSVSRLSGMVSGGKRMEVMVPCGDFFLDVAVLTALCGVKLKSGENEAAGEIVSAVVGA